jgi:hypothetical protein
MRAAFLAGASVTSGSSSQVNVVNLKAEGTFTNVLNHTNLADPNMNIGSPNFGLVSSRIGSDFGGARSGQVSMRIDF